MHRMPHNDFDDRPTELRSRESTPIGPIDTIQIRSTSCCSWQFIDLTVFVCSQLLSVCIHKYVHYVVIRHGILFVVFMQFLAFEFASVHGNGSHAERVFDFKHQRMIWNFFSYSRNCSGSHKIAKPSNHTKSSLAESISVERRTLGAEAARV